MIIADIAVMPQYPCISEEELYCVVDKVIDTIKTSGLKYEVGAMSTTVEGEFEKVFEIIKRCHHLPFELGIDRVITVVRIDEAKDNLTIAKKLKHYRN